MPRCESAAAWMHAQSSSVIGSQQWACVHVLCLFSHPPFPFLFLCRFCTAAADRKLRLLTSDLQDKHEVKVAQYLELTGQKRASQLASFSLAYTGDTGSCPVSDCRAAACKITPRKCSFTDHTLLFTWCFSSLLPRWWRATPATLTIWCSSRQRGNKLLQSAMTTLAGPHSFISMYVCVFPASDFQFCSLLMVQKLLTVFPQWNMTLSTTRFEWPSISTELLCSFSS